MAETRYQKTDIGRAEIRARALDLSRAARTLLLVIDPTKTGDEWVALIQGVGVQDLKRLVEHGLVAPIAVPFATPPAASPDVPTSGPALEQALARLGYRELYDRLTAEARARLGLIKGYRMVLEIEKCAGAPEIRSLASRFVGEVRAAHGETAARELCRALGIAG
jgi:hypothetical protein